ncbi:uncharacterized protein LOC143210266 [Lasioglossum baleicum]|uniref:uncharacterized protein LOC143210266 n=1 Tax=Lasioglossum baleicum TaxID=434251 RepID=UPI003FCD2386
MKMLEKHYNYHFYANVCHVCKQFGEGVSLRRCGNCTMIAYCCKEHQREHWPQHKDLCNVICNVLNDNKMINFVNSEEDVNTAKWAEMKMNFMLLVALKLPRRLELYEEQMFKFYRSCIVCHNQSSKELADCLFCPATSFCQKHRNDATHSSVCNKLKLCFKLDMASVTYKNIVPELRLPYNMNHEDLPQNMEDYVKHYGNKKRSLNLSVEEETMIDSEYLTRPLTFCYAMKKLCIFSWEENITIHVIGANMIEISGIDFWEILLHWLPKSTEAKIVLIGPELCSDSASLNLCKNCQSNNKQLSIQMHNVFYSNYVNSTSYTKPNFIIGYNAGISEYQDIKLGNDTWAQSLQTIAEQTCPFILTSYTLSEAREEQTRLETVLNHNSKCIFLGHNPYSGLRPYRDFETEDVYYQNQYIIIYKTLRL